MRDRNAFSEFVTHFCAKERKMKRSMNRTSCLSRIALATLGVAAILLAGSPPAGAAALRTWAGGGDGTGDWSVASNWNASVPASADIVYINNGGTASVTTAGDVGTTLYLGNVGAQSGSINQNGGTLAISSTLYLGAVSNGTGTFTQSGGTDSWALAYIGYAGTGSGIYNQTGGSLTMTNALYIGSSGTGTFTQSGGTDSLFTGYLGQNADSSGTYNHSSGNVTFSGIFTSAAAVRESSTNPAASAPSWDLPPL